MMNETNEFNQNPAKALVTNKDALQVKALDEQGHLLL